MPNTMQERIIYFYYMWSDGYGFSGRAIGWSFDVHRDWGELKLLTGVPEHLFPIAEEPPAPGDKVYWMQFEDNSWESKQVEAVVDYIVAGYAWVDTVPTVGASGSCVVNADGEVVGVVVWITKRGTSKQGVISLKR
jgi:hypothetical protein